jgi:hypothetical protein
MSSVANRQHYAECHNAECRCAEYHGAKGGTFYIECKVLIETR